MSIKVCQREYFTDHLPDALPLAVLEDINESFDLKYNLPKQEKKMRKAMRFAKTVYAKTMETKFVKKSDVLKVENLHIDEREMLKPLSDNLEHLFCMTGFTHEMVEECSCINALSNWCYSLKIPLSSSINFMKGALNEKIKKIREDEESAALLNFENTKLKKEEQDEMYRKIREMEKAAKEAEEQAERERKAKRRQAAVELMDLDLVIIKRVQKISIELPYVEGKDGICPIFLSSWKFQHLLDEAAGGVYGGAERPELEILEFEFEVFLPPPCEEGTLLSLKVLFDRVKSIFILTRKIEDRLLLYVHQGGRGNLWQHNIAPLKSAVCRIDQTEFSTLDVFLQKQWRRFLIKHIAPLRTDPDRVSFVRSLRNTIVTNGEDIALTTITPDESEHDSSSSEDSRARRKRLRKEKRLKKKKDEERKARKEKKKKKKKKAKEEKKTESIDEKAHDSAEEAEHDEDDKEEIDEESGDDEAPNEENENEGPVNNVVSENETPIAAN